MEKIKSVLSGHKKSEDATHDAHASSTPAAGAHREGENHPIYDEMKGTSSAQPTAARTTSAGQTGATTGLGQTEYRGTDAPIGSHSATTGTTSRPSGHMHEGISEASIKSGVIGFGGSGEPQGHAALPSHNSPEANLDRNQIVGGGNMAPGPTTSDTSNQPSTLKSALPLAGTSTSDQPHSSTGALGSTTQSSTTHQPFEQTLRQESYTNDTDRSFPLAGGVASKHDSSSSHPTDHNSRSHHPTEHHTSSVVPPTQQTSTTSHPITSEREPGTKEKEVGVRDGHGREGLAGAAAAATAIGVAAPLSQSHQRDVHGQGSETREATYGGQPSATSSTDPTSTTTQSHHPDALAAATAAATKSSATSSSTHGQGVGAQDNSFASTSRAPVTGSTNTEPADSRYTDPGRPPGGRKLSYRHVPGGFPSPTPDDAKTFLFYRDEVVPEPGVDGPVINHAPSTRGLHGTHGGAHHSSESSSAAPIAAGVAGGLATGGVAGGLASSQERHHGDEVARGTSTAGPHQSDTLNKLDPKVDSDLDGSRTTSGPTTSGPAVGHATNAPLTTGEVPGSGAHELRHTGSLEQPTPRSAEHTDEHHHGRDAAIAGGVGAGAAGLGYAATHHKDTPDVAGVTQSSPYSSKQLDPRALGSQAKLGEQRFDPQARSEPGTHHTAQSVAPVGVSSRSHEHHGDVSKEKSTTGPHKSSLLNKLDPRVKNDTSTKHEGTGATAKQDKHDDHHARDAALVGGGAATTAGVHHSLQRNDTAGAGTAVLPEEQTSRGTGALSSTTTNPTTQTTSASAPLPSATSSVPDQTSRTSAQQSVHPGDAPHPAATKKYEPYQGPMTTDGSPFYGTVGAPAPIEGNRSPVTGASTTAPVHGHQDAHTSSTIPATQQQDSQHHHGRDTALVGAGAATAGGLYASHHDRKAETGPASSTVGPNTTDPASKTIGPHESNVANVLDPRVQPDPSKQKSHTTTGPHQSDTLNRLDPKVDEKAGHQDQHHLGRDAAVVGGTGAAGYGAHEAIDAYGSHRSTQPGASMNEQRYDTGASGARAPNPVPAAGHYDYNNEHTSRNVALGSGAALGAGGLYAASKHGNETSQAPLASNQPLGSSSQAAPLASNQPLGSHPAPLASNQPLGSSTHAAPLASSQPLSSSHAAPLSQHSTQGSSATAYPPQGTVAPQNTHSGLAGTSHAPHDSVQEPYEKDHSKRDAAVLGTAGAAAVGGAAYAHNQQSDVERERARLEKEQQERLKKEQHDREKEQHKLDKEHAKQEKEAHKLEKEQHKHEKEQHKHDKAVLAAEKQEHKHEKEQEKEAHRLEKEREKEAHRLEKEREKETGTPEKKHGILGFLHRDKSKKEKTSSVDNSPRQSGEVRRSVDNSRHSRDYDDNNPDSPRWKGKNLLHKDPPKGHPAREALEHHELGAMGAGNREHVGTDGQIGDPNAISGAHQTRNNTYGAEPLDSAVGQTDNRVIEPHTGLPMNVGKYGDGHGGTDANPTVRGHHEHAGGVGGAGQ